MMFATMAISAMMRKTIAATIHAVLDPPDCVHSTTGEGTAVMNGVNTKTTNMTIFQQQ